MKSPDEEPKRFAKPWFWDLLHRAGTEKPEPVHEITFHSPDISDEKVAQQWQRLSQSIKQESGEETERHSIRKGFIYRVAAAVTLLLLTGGSIWTYLQTSMNAYATQYGETARIKLPDGSLVTLNANSKLTYGNWKDEEDREVWLHGEAFFEVQKKKRPGGKVKFTVHTNDLNVEVVGTRFNVSDRGARTQVVLEEGKIRLRLTRNTNTIIDMKPGELIEYVEAERLPVKQEVNPKAFIAWKDDQLVLNGKSMRDVAKLITENYGIKVLIQDSASSDLQLQGTIPAHNLDELIEALTLAADVNIKREPNRLIIQQPSN
jgi:transmembrane sensor